MTSLTTILSMLSLVYTRVKIVTVYRNDIAVHHGISRYRRGTMVHRGPS